MGDLARLVVSSDGDSDAALRIIHSLFRSGSPGSRLISTVHLGGANGSGVNTFKQMREILHALGIVSTNVDPHKHHMHIYLRLPTPLNIGAAIVAGSQNDMVAYAEVALLDDAESMMPDIQQVAAEETKMFILDMPYVPADQTLAAASPQASYGTIGICHFAENPSEPDNAANMFNFSTDVKNYFADRRWAFSGQVSATVSRPPQHGTLTADYPDYPGIYTYHPDPGYLGSDRITVVATIGGKTLRMEYYVRVMNFVPVDDQQPDMYERGYCPVNSRVWQISMLPDASNKSALLVDEFTPGSGDSAAFWASSIVPSAIHVRIADLPGTMLAQTTGSEIVIDKDAAGFGWYVQGGQQDSSAFLPTSNPSVFQARDGSEAQGKMDLLSVLWHEFGHVLGLDHSDARDDFMSAALDPGTRRLPTDEEMAALRTLYDAAATAGVDPTGNPTDPALPLGLGFTIFGLGRLRRSAYGGWTVAIESAKLQPAEGQTATRNEVTTARATLGSAFDDWTHAGVGQSDDGSLVMAENSADNAHLEQSFMVGAQDRYVAFTVDNDMKADANGPGDAFEVALLNRATGASLVGTDGLTSSDAAINIQATGQEALSSSVHKVRNADGSTTYYLDLQSGAFAGQAASLSFDLIGFGATDSTVSIRDIHLVQQPLAMDDAFATDEDTALTLPVLANDLPGGAAATSITVVDGPLHGTIELDADGLPHYTPAANYNGEDSFTYRYTTADGQSNVATVRITVRPVNDVPTVQDSLVEATIMAGKPSTFDPLAGASDVEGDLLAARLVGQPAHGTVVANVDGTWTYVADVTYAGMDELTYVVDDGTGSSQPVTVRFTVLPANTAPVAHDAELALQEDGSILIDFSAFGEDAEGDALGVRVTAMPAHGTLERQDDGRWLYRPGANWFGAEELRFVLNDGQLDSNEAVLRLDVAAVNDAPTVTGRDLTLAEDDAVSFDPLSSAADVDGDSLIVRVVTGPAHGTLAVNADGTFTYRPDPDFNGADSFTYRVNDGQADSDVVTVNLTVTPVDDAPVARDGAAALDEDGSLVFDLRDLGYDIDSATLSAEVLDGPLHGTVERLADGTYRYTPAPDFNGDDQLRFRLGDGELVSNDATLHITVRPVNDAPVAGDLAATLDEDSEVTLRPVDAAHDVDGDALSVRVVSGPAHGIVTVNADGSISYRPSADYNGTDSYTYVVNDGQVDSNVATVTLTITPVNDAPTARASLAVGSEDTAIVLRWSDFAIADVDGDVLAITLTDLPAQGTLQVLRDGAWSDAAVGARFTKDDLDADTLRFVPAANASGGAGYAAEGYGDQHAHYARVGYSVSDGQADPVASYVDIDITAVADAPQLQLLGDTVQRRVFSTDWESAPNVSSQSTLVSGNVFEGWSLITGTDMHGMGQGLGGGKDGFEIWSSGDQMVDAYDRVHTVSAAADGGSNWLEINDAGGAQFQTLGIARQVTTEKGAKYNLSFDLAGRLGYGANTTRIAVYVDNVRIATFDNTSGISALDWQHATAAFVGNGGKQVVRIVTDASDRDMGGRGMMVDNIALDETVQLNHGRQGGAVLLQGVQAGLVDTDGSEQLTLTLAGLPVGTTIGDGTHSFTVTEQVPVADITGWNTYALAITPPASFHGQLTLQLNATATEAATGSQAVVGKTIVVDVEAVAQVPTLTLAPSAANVSRVIVDTSWEDVRDPTYGATVADVDRLDGWTSMEVTNGKDEAFVVWADGDRMSNATGRNVTVQAAQGAGENWLALNNGVNSGTSSYYDSLGIERDVPTIDGATYTFTLDYAGALGLSAANTRIGVYVDGIQIGSYASTSPNDALNWENLSFAFKGNGAMRSLRIQLEGGTDTSTAKGAMIDALKVVETLPNSANVAYGFVNATIALPVIGSSLASGDDGATLKTALVGLPEGAVLTDGVQRGVIGCDMPSVDLTGWNLAALVITPPHNFVGSIKLQVRATSVHADNGSTATVTRDLTVNVLGGAGCATPVGVNPYVSYLADTAVVATDASTPIVVGAFTPIVEDAFVMTGIIGDLMPVDSVDESLEDWMRRLTGSVGDALMGELRRVFG